MNLEIPVTRTRIIVPRVRNDFLSRPRLLDILDSLLEKKIILVSAPAGYGKTSLLVDFASRVKIPVCWYAIDPLDQDPLRFITYLITTIQQQFPSFGKASFEALSSSAQVKPDLDYLVSAIVNDAYDHINEHFLIVLDDYHLVDQSDQVNHFISRFVQDVDENCHVIFASRTLLSLPDLPLMVARSLAGGLSFEELAFSLPEIKGLYKLVYQQALDDIKAEQLAAQTEGWITGLLLTAQNPSADVDIASLSHRTAGIGLNEYFQQLLVQNPIPVQEFLLRSSLLEEFDAGLCQDAIGLPLDIYDVEWENLMALALRYNLFVLPVGEDGTWLRYHHLFRDFLQATMARERPLEAEKIWLQIALIAQKKGEWEQAYTIYRRLNYVEELANLIEKAGPSLTVGGRLSTLAEWLDELPIEVIAKRPELVSLQGNVAVMKGDTKQGIVLFNQALSAMKLPDDREAMARTFTRRSAAYRMVGNHSAAMNDGKQILSLVKGDLILRNLEADAMRSIGVSLYQQGNAAEALPWLQNSIEIYKSIKDEKNEAVVSLEAGVIHEALGNYSQAENLYEGALAFWRDTHNSVWQANVLNNLGVLQHLMGNYEVATSTLEKAMQHARLSGYQRLEAFALAGIGDIYRDLDAITEAGDVYDKALDIAQRIEEKYLIVYIHIAQAVITSLNNHYAIALAQLAEAEQAARDMQAAYEISLCQYEKAFILIRQKQYAEAVEILTNCLDSFEKSGYAIQADRARYLLMASKYFLDQKDEARALIRQIGTVENLTPLVWVASQLSGLFDGATRLRDVFRPLERIRELVETFQNRLPTLRRRIREKASTVPFAPAKLTIRTLGRMQVKVNGKVITNALWQTQNARDLFFLLLIHPEGLTKEFIGLIFWPDASPEDVRFRFKNTVYRVRKATGKDTILLQDDYYRFNTTLDYEYDVEIFNQAIEQAELTDDPDFKLNYLNMAVNTYKGLYLPELEDTWVIPEREHLRQVFQDATLQLAEIYMQQKKYQHALDICMRVLNEDPSLEEAYRISMRVHAAMGNTALVARQFERCVQVLADEIGVAPSPQTQNLYQTLLK